MYRECEVIDADAHVQEPGDLWDRYIDRRYFDERPQLGDDGGWYVCGRPLVRARSQTKNYARHEAAKRDRYDRFSDARARGFDPESHVEYMDSVGIDRMVLYPTLGSSTIAIDDLDGRITAAIGRAYNRWLADYTSACPGRLFGVGLVSLNDPAAAAAEAEYAIGALGLAGLVIRPNPVFGRNLHAPEHDVFYDAVERLGVGLAVHEGCGVQMRELGTDRFDEVLLWHATCHPMEQMAAVASFTVGGILERHPSLRVAFLEAGAGWLPYWLHRLDEHVEVMPYEAEHLSMAPSRYFGSQCWIGAESGEVGLDLVVDTVGAGHLLWASDYPHYDCDPAALKRFMDDDQLGEDERTTILSESPAAFYGPRVAAAAPAGER